MKIYTLNEFANHLFSMSTQKNHDNFTLLLYENSCKHSVSKKK